MGEAALDWRSATMDVADYLEMEQRSSTARHEFVDGVIYAMVGASDWHGIIAGNIFASLHRQIASPCQAFISDMKLRIKTDLSERYYYPDVLVACDPSDRNRYWRERPTLLVEVLSDTTMRTDRHEKLPAYTAIPGIAEVLLVDSRSWRIELYDAAAGFRQRLVGPGETVPLLSGTASLSADDVYRGVEWPQTPEA